MSSLSSHVLDTSIGRPAAGVALVLEQRQGDSFASIATATTNSDGRAANFVGTGSIVPGEYRLRFATAEYHAIRGEAAFFPEVVIHFVVTEPDAHYHIPLLLAPFGYSTYRGS
jgi:5-hydroxyisourate hydrolase